MTIVAVTGHRPNSLGGYHEAVTAKLVRIASAHFSQHPPEKVITGMALGWDQAVAYACYRLSIPYVAAVPFVGQEALWVDSSKVWYRKLLEKASEVVIVSEGEYAAYKLHKRNQWMVDQLGPSDELVALYDGSPTGGTANCVKYAIGKKVRITNLWDTFRITPL